MYVTATNLVGTPLINYSVTLTIPKELARTANEISGNYPYDVLVEDPVIRFTLDELVGRETVEFYFTNKIPEAFDAKRIGTDITHADVNPEELEALDQNELSIIPTFTETADGTKIELALKPGSKLTDVTIPLEIPKCMALSMSEIDFEQENYAVINDDPLMVWTFRALPPYFF